MHVVLWLESRKKSSLLVLFLVDNMQFFLYEKMLEMHIVFLS